MENKEKPNKYSWAYSVERDRNMHQFNREWNNAKEERAIRNIDDDDDDDFFDDDDDEK